MIYLGEQRLGKPTNNQSLNTETIRSICTQSDFANCKQEFEKNVHVFIKGFYYSRYAVTDFSV